MTETVFSDIIIMYCCVHSQSDIGSELLRFPTLFRIQNLDRPKGTVTGMKKYEQRPVTVIIAAAGSGSRMGSVYKPLMKLNGRHTLLYSLDMFMSCDCVERVVVSARREELYLLREICARENYPREILVVPGGENRQESVMLAFKAAFENRPKTRFTAVHDAARPLITREEFLRAYDAARLYGNVACACRAKDTFKRTDADGLVIENVDRENLWHIATPQIADSDMLHTAMALAKQNGELYTDESGMLTAAGFLVKLSEGSQANIKLTYPEDVAIAEAILAQRAEKSAPLAPQ